MKHEVIEQLATFINQDYQHNISGERDYKLKQAAGVRQHLLAARAGTGSWEDFVGKSRRLMTNQLGWRAVDALKNLAAADPSGFGAMVAAVWDDDDLAEADARLTELISSVQPEAAKAVRGLGTRAAVLSFLRLVGDPAENPIYRPRNTGDAIATIYGTRLEGDDPASLLRNYDQRLDELLAAFQTAGLPLQDRLDVQAVLYKAKEADLVEGASIRSSANKQREKKTESAGDPAHDQRKAAPVDPAGELQENDLEPATAADLAACLPDLQAWLRSRDLHYPNELLAHFLAALLTKPFVILSGPSGTGKTRLALEVGACLGAIHVVPVKPDWTDTRSVLGYPNPLTGIYQQTETLRAALLATRTTQPVMLVLDEMNLAQVERYFADVLSAMESRHSIPLHTSEEMEQQGIPQQLAWPDNLLVVGTVNADETTYPFSWRSTVCRYTKR